MLHKGEIGVIIYVNYGDDISAATCVILCEPEAGTIKEFTATVPATDVTANGVTYLANKYALYTTTSTADLDYAGRWKKKLKVTFSASDIKQTNYENFRVLS